MRHWACLIILVTLTGITSHQIKDSSSSASQLDLDLDLDLESELQVDEKHPPQIIDPWAKRYLKALSSAGDLSSYYQDEDNKDWVFPARFKTHHSNRNLCHGKLMAEEKETPMPPRSFYGWDQDYCEWLTAVSYAKMTPEQQQTYVKDPTLYFYPVPEDEELFLYTESREVLENTIGENLKKLPTNRKAEWDGVSAEWKDKVPAVKLVNEFCEMMDTSHNLWPAKFRGTINRLPLSGALLIAMSEMGARMELQDDDNPNMTPANRLEKVAAFYTRYANDNAQKKMQPWIKALSNNTRADDWVSNTQLEVTLCKSPDSSVGSEKIKSYQQTSNDITQIYPDTCATLWNKDSASIHDEPVILDYGAAMRIGKKCGKKQDKWCRPALFGITTEQFPEVTLRVRQHNMKKLFSLKRRGRGPVTAEYNALIDQLIGFLAVPDWLSDVQVVELRIIAKRVLDILDPPKVVATRPPTTAPPMNCCCCMGCVTCCGNPIGKLKQDVLKQKKHKKKILPPPPANPTDVDSAAKKDGSAKDDAAAKADGPAKDDGAAKEDATKDDSATKEE